MYNLPCQGVEGITLEVYSSFVVIITIHLKNFHLAKLKSCCDHTLWQSMATIIPPVCGIIQYLYLGNWLYFI